MLGYVITYEEKNRSGEYIPEAFYLKRNTALKNCPYETDDEVAHAAHNDGIRLIYDMDGIPDGVYLDTPQNRTHILAALIASPQYKTLKKAFCSYAKEKLAMLEEFGIELSYEDRSKLAELTSEISIDNFMRVVFQKYL